MAVIIRELISNAAVLQMCVSVLVHASIVYSCVDIKYKVMPAVHQRLL